MKEGDRYRSLIVKRLRSATKHGLVNSLTTTALPTKHQITQSRERILCKRMILEGKVKLIKIAKVLDAPGLLLDQQSTVVEQMCYELTINSPS